MALSLPFAPSAEELITWEKHTPLFSAVFLFPLFPALSSPPSNERRLQSSYFKNPEETNNRAVILLIVHSAFRTGSRRRASRRAHCPGKTNVFSPSGSSRDFFMRRHEAETRSRQTPKTLTVKAPGVIVRLISSRGRLRE